MVNIGIIYLQIIGYPHRNFFPIVEKGWSHEIEEPYRKGTCLVFRFPFTKLGFVVGIWGEKQTEEDALTAALWGRHLGVPVEELLEWD